MEKTPYQRFEKEELILRDELALDRTLLANERTLLAYLRLAIALLIAGLSIMHFTRAGWYWAVGLVCLPAGLAAAGIGLIRFRKMNRAFRLIRGRIAPPGGQAAPD